MSLKNGFSSNKDSQRRGASSLRTIFLFLIPMVGVLAILLLSLLLPSGFEPLADGDGVAAAAPDGSKTGLVSGQIFIDYDRNGTPNLIRPTGGIDYAEVNGPFASDSISARNQIEFSDFVIRATDIADNVITSPVSADGSYELDTSLLLGDDFVIEIVLPGDYSEASRRPETATTQPGFSHIFDVPESGVQNWDIGVLPPSRCPFTQDSSGKYWSTCFVKGDIGDGTGPLDVWVGGDYSGPANAEIEHYFTKAELGSIWGVVYDEWTGILYSSAFLKRHSELGPQGLDGLYWFEYTGGNVTVNDATLFSASLGDTADVGGSPSSYFVNSGIGDLPSRDANVLDHTAQTFDVDVFSWVGKTGVGGIDLSPDGKTLFVANLDAKSIASYDVSDAINGNISYIGELAISDANADCPDNSGNASASDWMPFSVTSLSSNHLVLGVACTAQTSGDPVDLEARIIEIEIDGQTSLPTGANGAVFTQSLDYDRGCPLARTCNWDFPGQNNAPFPEGAGNGNFSPWHDTWDESFFTFGNSSSADSMVFDPQPLVSSVTFDVNGDMNIAIMDRFGHQTGFDDPPPIQNDARAFRNAPGGELIKVCNAGTVYNPVYEVEGTGSCGTNFESTQPDPNDLGFHGGPGTADGEFYGEEEFLFHLETSTGGSWQPPRGQEILTTQADPVRGYSGGLSWYSTVDGSTLRDFELYYFNPEQNEGTPGTFSKANGMGDVDGCFLPVEIGDRVWFDVNADGIQSPGEVGLEGTTVTLIDENGDVVGTTTTDEDGYYYFDTVDGVSGSTTYTVTFDISTVTNVDSTTLGILELTDPNQGSNDEADSDTVRNGNGEDVLTINPFDPGFIGHTFDTGYSPSSGIELGDLPDRDLFPSAPGYNDEPDPTNPIGYPTTLDQGGPSHIVPPNPVLTLGNLIDTDPDGVPDLETNGDDAGPDQNDDEDGVTFTPIITKGLPFTVTIRTTITGSAGITATTSGWVDLDGDFKFSDDEFVTFTIVNPSNGGNTVVSTAVFTSQADGPDQIFSRFRTSFDPSEVGQIDDYMGPATSGEIEDYNITLIPNAIELVRFVGWRVGDRKARIVWETATETNNLGFELYRAPAGGSFESATQIHFEESSITNQDGATYEYIDTVSQYGVYTYWLVDLDLEDGATTHGPISVNLNFFWDVYLPFFQGE